MIITNVHFESGVCHIVYLEAKSIYIVLTVYFLSVFHIYIGICKFCVVL